MLQFHPNINLVTAHSAIRQGLTQPCAITVFSGTQPLAAEVAANWNTYRPSVLCHWVGGTFNALFPAATIGLTTFPADVAATASGTATWGIIWSTNLTATNVAGTTLPNTSFIVGPVSVSDGDGIIRLREVTLTAGALARIADASIGVRTPA